MLSSIAAKQLEENSCGKPFTLAGSESYTGTEARSLLYEESQQPTYKKKKTVSNQTLYNYACYSAQN